MVRATAALAALALAACAPSSSADHRIVARAEAICVKAQERAQRLRLPIGGDHGFVKELETLIDDAAREYAAVEPPARNTVAYGHFVAALERQAELLRRWDTALRAMDRAAVERLSAALRANTVDIEAHGRSLKLCVRPIIQPTGG